MFDFDTDAEGGSRGPWVSWFSAGSVKKRVGEASWALRDKDDADNVVYTPVTAFNSGVVFDLDSLRLGYIADDGAKGQAPSKAWAPDRNLKTFPNPEPNKKNAMGGDFWRKALSIRVALSKTQAATWEQSGFAAFEAFNRLGKLIKAEYDVKGGNRGLLPVVKQTGVETIPSRKGQDSNVPLLTIVRWVERPECLRNDSAAGFDAGPSDDAPLSQQAMPQQRQAAPAPVTVDADDFG